MAGSDSDGGTAYTVDRIPSGLWTSWKDIVPRSIRLGDRIIRLIAADLASDTKHGEGLVELAVDEGLLEEDEIDAAKETDAT